MISSWRMRIICRNIPSTFSSRSLLQYIIHSGSRVIVFYVLMCEQNTQNPTTWQLLSYNDRISSPRRGPISQLQRAMKWQNRTIAQDVIEMGLFSLSVSLEEYVGHLCIYEYEYAISAQLHHQRWLRAFVINKIKLINPSTSVVRRGGTQPSKKRNIKAQENRERIRAKLNCGGYNLKAINQCF